MSRHATPSGTPPVGAPAPANPAARAARTMAVPVASEQAWYLVAIAGVLNAAMGVLLLVYPDVSLKLLGVFLGIDLLLFGVLLIVRGFSGLPETSGQADVLLGILGLIGGVVVLRNPGETVTLLALAFAIFLIVAGALALSRGLIRREGRATALIKGVILVAAGTVIVSWPKISLGTMVALAGISLCAAGLVEIVEAFVLRRRRDDAGPAAEPAPARP